jgi:Escherichia/Staphylococcus phage prohead protease
MSMKREIRFAGAELRASGNLTITGRPAMYHSLSKDLGGFREVLLPGCFDESLSDPEIYATFNHNDSAIIGRVSAGTLEVDSDSIGLTMRCELPNNTVGRDLYESIKRQDVTKMSFGMYVKEDAWDVAADERGLKYERRSVKRARLFEVSPVVTPAYDASSVSARALFPDGQPERSKLAASAVEVNDRDLALMRAKLELAKRK